MRSELKKTNKQIGGRGGGTQVWRVFKSPGKIRLTDGNDNPLRIVLLCVTTTNIHPVIDFGGVSPEET